MERPPLEYLEGVTESADRNGSENMPRVSINKLKFCIRQYPNACGGDGDHGDHDDDCDDDDDDDDDNCTEELFHSINYRRY